MIGRHLVEKVMKQVPALAMVATEKVKRSAYACDLVVG